MYIQDSRRISSVHMAPQTRSRTAASYNDTKSKRQKTEVHNDSVTAPSKPVRAGKGQKTQTRNTSVKPDQAAQKGKAAGNKTKELPML